MRVLVSVCAWLFVAQNQVRILRIRFWFMRSSALMHKHEPRTASRAMPQHIVIDLILIAVLDCGTLSFGVGYS